MRWRQRPAGRFDAGRASFRGNDTDTAGFGDRSRRRLEAELERNEALMPAGDLHYCELVEVGQRIQKRDLSAVEATQAQLDRIARLDGSLKTSATVMPSSALEQAEDADKAIAKG